MMNDIPTTAPATTALHTVPTTAVAPLQREYPAQPSIAASPHELYELSEEIQSLEASDVRRAAFFREPSPAADPGFGKVLRRIASPLVSNSEESSPSSSPWPEEQTQLGDTSATQVASFDTGADVLPPAVSSVAPSEERGCLEPSTDVLVAMLQASGDYSFRHGSLSLCFACPVARTVDQTLHDYLAQNTCQMLQALVSLKTQTDTILAEAYAPHVNPVGQAYRGTISTARDILNTLTDRAHKARVTGVVAAMEPKLRRVLQATEEAMQTDTDEPSKALIVAASALAMACVSLSDIVEKGTKSYARFRPAGEVHPKVPGFQASMRELS